MAATAKQNVGVIDPTKFYSFEAFKRDAKVGTKALREARRNGLKVKYQGRQGWIKGQWWFDYIEDHGRDSR